jgi:hypothetical protein
VAIVQEAGESNPLGLVKFMFPNKHDVYMHDTPTKNLFNSSVRTFSHGCIRVRNPRELAEHIFAADRGWTADKVADVLDSAGDNTRIDLSQPIPVHNTYFTVWVGADGAVRSFDDIYGHDKRIDLALSGTPASVIAQSDPARKLKQEVAESLEEGAVVSAGLVTTLAKPKKPARAPSYSLGGPGYSSGSPWWGGGGSSTRSRGSAFQGGRDGV